MAVNLACVGTSFITEQTLAALKNVPAVQPYAIYSRSLEKAQAYALNKAYDNFDEMLADPQVELVYIASPNTLHYEQAKRSLQAKKHVVLEKPFVQTLSEAQELFALADAQGIMLFEAITTIHNESYKYLKTHLKELGPVRHFYANYSQFSSRYSKYLSGEVSNIFDPAFAGGSLGDLNIYNLHLAVGLFGAPKKSQYFANRGFNTVDTSGVAVLSYDGFHALCFGAKDSNGRNGVEIQGEKGYFYMKEESRSLAAVESNLPELAYSPPIIERLEHEWLDFSAALMDKDTEAYEQWKAHTLAVVQVYETLQKGS